MDLSQERERIRCAVCGGNGETCKFEKSSYTKDHRSYGKFTAQQVIQKYSGTCTL